MIESKSWEAVKEFYDENFGLSEGLVELMSNYEILLACVSGISNSRICYRMNLDEDELHHILNEWLSFDGWEEDLDLNPYSIYKRIPDYCLSTFIDEVKVVSHMYSDEGITTMFRVCSIFYRLEDMLENEWK